MGLLRRDRPTLTARGRLLLMLSRERSRVAQDALLDDLLELDRQTLAELDRLPVEVVKIDRSRDSDAPAGVDGPGATK